VVVLEATMGGRGSAFGEVATLIGAYPHAAVLVLTSDLSPTVVDASVEHGCLGVVPKTCSVDALGRAVRAVAQGERHMHPRALTALLQTRQAAGELRNLRPLSKREIAVLNCAAEGMTNGEIAEQLGITAETVKTHLSRVQDKLHARDRTHAVSRALRLGVLT
jgi:DNA-binding NarL/FixJ family response regulator